MDSRHDLPAMNPSFRFGVSESPFPRSLPLTSTLPPAALRILSERRPSLPLSPILASPRDNGSESSAESAMSDHSTFYQRLRIDIKQPVGNMSISPANRDVCLAARKGLFIIDLERPYETPRFLPQGGTWEVADVQWNPHPARANFVVSTSSQKLLIWDLCATGQTSIIHILNAHYRAITDINWSPFEPEVIASCGIDSWVWAWDLRAGQRPVFGLSAWDAPATQVKWNRQDRHLLASSHDGKVLVWDDRKGSLPLTVIRAHGTAKIYGIDWCRSAKHEIVTCSLDKTVKFWSIDAIPQQSPLNSINSDETPHTPQAAINTKYPVWRARHLPFGRGIMCLPQRGETTLEMYHKDHLEAPIWQADGHTDVVKEFVWRTKGGEDPNRDDREFQLITWSKDHTLRLWPVPQSVLQAAGHIPGSKIEVLVTRRGAKNESFRELVTPATPATSEPMLSAPLGNRGILAGVRAGVARGTKSSSSANISGPPSTAHTYKGASSSSDGQPSSSEKLNRRPSVPRLPFVSTSIVVQPTTPGGFMTRGKAGGGKLIRSGITPGGLGDQMTWIASVKLEKREGSSAAGSGSGPTSRIPSRSRAASIDRAGEEHGFLESRSGSRSMDTEMQEKELPEHLADELAMIGRRFGTRVTCERADVSKKRTCTFTLLGPWRDDFALTFIRISFEFPKDYWKTLNNPQATSIPSFDLDKIAGISLKTRAFLLKKLRAIRVQRRPCLEACLSFLLGESTAFGYPYGRSEVSDSDDDSMVDGTSDTRKTDREGREGMIMIKNKPGNIPRPRRSQGVFGPNGELVCFFLNTPVRIHSMGGRRNVSPSPSIASRSTVPTRPYESAISQALRGLSRLTNDGSGVPLELETRPRNGLFILDSMFMTSMQRSATRESRDTHASSSYIPRPICTVSIKFFAGLTIVDRGLAADYKIEATNPATRCLLNANIAKNHERFDHERVWTTLYRLFSPSVPHYDDTKAHSLQDSDMLRAKNGKKMPHTMTDDSYFTVRWGTHPLAKQIVTQLYNDFAQKRDLQMLAMLSITLLEIDRLISEGLRSQPKVIHSEAVTSKPRIDYFSLRPRDPPAPSPQTPPAWPRLPSFTSSPSLTLSFPTSRGSWTFPSRLLGSTQETSPTPGTQGPPSFASSNKRERTASNSTNPLSGSPKMPSIAGGAMTDFASRMGTTSIPVPSTPGGRTAESPKRKASLLLGRSTESPPGILKTWSEPALGPSPARINVSFAPGGGKRWPPPSASSRAMAPVKEKKKAISLAMMADEEEEALYASPFAVNDEERGVYEAHVVAYAEALFRWQLPYKRAEILKCIGREALSTPERTFLHILSGIDHEGQICISELCSMCSTELNPGDEGKCGPCRRQNQKMRCSVCRLPAAGLSHSCLKCCHITHYSCWRSQKLRSCPTGCGCICSDFSGNFEVDAISVPLVVASFPPTPDVLSPSATMSADVSQVQSPQTPGIDYFTSRIR